MNTGSGEREPLYVAIGIRGMIQHVRTHLLSRALPAGGRADYPSVRAPRTVVDHPWEVIETALAHVVRGRIEAAYAQLDLFGRRRRLKDAWTVISMDTWPARRCRRRNRDSRTGAVLDPNLPDLTLYGGPGVDADSGVGPVLLPGR